MSWHVLLIAVAVLSVAPAHGADADATGSMDDYPVKNFVVVMLENRAFDHMLGYLKRLNPEINGLNGDESNPLNTTDPDSELVFVNENAVYVDPDPDHSLVGTSEQVFGGDGTPRDPATMNGFVQSARHHIPQDPRAVMACFNHSSVPIISTLAMEFAVCDSWYPSIPGPTEVNRMYSHAGTSAGWAATTDLDDIIGFPQRPFYANLLDAGVSFGIFFEQLPTALILDQVRTPDIIAHMGFYDEFKALAAAGKLPQYSFLDPSYFPLFGKSANDQHPSHSVAEGERLLKDIYESVRNSPQWNQTMLIITYDEHGGFYDHVPTPQHNVPNPDGINSVNPPFNFTRLGVRIPTIFVSPWINKGVVLHDPQGPTKDSKFEHSSIPATLKKIFNLPNFLTKRDAWAGTFEDIALHRKEPRTDCPTTLPDIPARPQEELEREYALPVNHLQLGLMDTAARFIGDGTKQHRSIATQLEAGTWVHRLMSQYLAANRPISGLRTDSHKLRAHHTDHRPHHNRMPDLQ